MTAHNDLARRAVACRDWRWLPGMRTIFGGRILAVYPTGGIDIESSGAIFVVDDVDRGEAPDLDDPATLGCLLALVREAWGDPRGCVIPMAEGRWAWKSANTVDAVLRRPIAIRGDTEAEALVAALEAAADRAGGAP